MSDFDILVLDNGIRVLHKEVPHTRIAHCGFILDIGSRDEKADEEGLAHFWEHMAFKGTSRRKSFHIFNGLESVGGDLNAYTTKEKIYFYASVLDAHFEKALDLLHDITFNSTFPSKEIEIEKNVIIEEMAMYEEAPDEMIMDEFDRMVFGDHPLGKNILGTRQSVSSFKQNNFLEFVHQNLDTSRLIFSSVGNISSKKVFKLAKKYLNDIPSKTISRERITTNGFLPRVEEHKKARQQAHCIIGRDAFGLKHESRLPMFMLSHLLGGPILSSRLNMELREKRGYVYHVEANYQSYSDTGIFGIYFGTEPKLLNKSKNVVLREMNILRTKKLGENQLHKLKEQIKGQLAMAEESNLGMMQVMGKSMLDLGRVESIKDIFAKIDAINSNQLIELAEEFFNPNQMSTLIYLPENNGFHS